MTWGRDDAGAAQRARCSSAHACASCGAIVGVERDNWWNTGNITITISPVAPERTQPRLIKPHTAALCYVDGQKQPQAEPSAHPRAPPAQPSNPNRPRVCCRHYILCVTLTQSVSQ